MNTMRSIPTKRPRKISLQNGRFPISVELKRGRRGRARLSRNVGVSCIAVGWVFSFAALIASKTCESILTPLELSIAATALFSFGVAWQICDEMERP